MVGRHDFEAAASLKAQAAAEQHAKNRWALQTFAIATMGFGFILAALGLVSLFTGYPWTGEPSNAISMLIVGGILLVTSRITCAIIKKDR